MLRVLRRSEMHTVRYEKHCQNSCPELVNPLHAGQRPGPRPRARYDVQSLGLSRPVLIPHHVLLDEHSVVRYLQKVYQIQVSTLSSNSL
jgi:hypothetical protein